MVQRKSGNGGTDVLVLDASVVMKWFTKEEPEEEENLKESVQQLILAFLLTKNAFYYKKEFRISTVTSM